MFRSKIIPFAAAAAMACGLAATAYAESGSHENSKETAIVLGAKTSIAQAIAAAEQQSLGRALRIDVEKENGAYLYEVKTASADKISKVFIDPMSGRVVHVADEGLLARLLDRDDKAEFDKLTTAPTTLAAAVAAAEQHVGGKAVEAGLDDDNGALFFKIAVARDNAIHHVRIDSTSGKVTSASVDDDGEHEE